MSKIQHPNVIRLKEVDWDCVYTRKNGETTEVILVVLELATGGELFEFLSYTGCFEESIARTYFHQLISGVAYCHSKGVAHRDLKPENLLLDSSFTLKLADFGFSNVFTPTDKVMFTECGTPGYMAPEMIKSPDGYEPTGADVWACGVILFIMLAGFPPFQKPNLSDWWFQKLAVGKHHLFWQAHSRNAYFSESTKDFINKILCPDPSKRITITEMKKHAWFNGPIISQTALVTEFTRRKNEVDATKFRDKLEKKKREAAAAAAAGGKSALEGMDYRAIGLEGGVDGEGIPVSAPSMVGFSTGAAAMLIAPEAQSAADAAPVTLDSLDMAAESRTVSGDFESDDKVEKGKESGPLPPKYDEGASIACYTRFESAAAPKTIFSRLQRGLTAAGAQFSTDDAVFKLKAKMLTSSGSITFVAQLFSAPAGVTVVEFRRRNGDAVHFLNLFMEFSAALTDIIVPKPASRASTPSTPLGDSPREPTSAATTASASAAAPAAVKA